MRRVVVTGLGIVSCLGNDRQQVLEALKNGQSGIRFKEEYAERGFRSHVAGVVDIDLDELVDRAVEAAEAGERPESLDAMMQD